MTLFDYYYLLPAFLLVFCRVGGLMLAAPVFSAPVIPMQVKVLFTAAMSLTIFPMVAPQLAVPVTLGSALAGLAGELMVGLFLGMGVNLLFVGMQLGMQVASQQAGMGLANSFDPVMETSISPVAHIYYIVGVFMFLIVGGHRALVRALLESFQSVGPLQFRLDEPLVGLLLDMFSASFSIAIRVGGPLMLALFLAFLTLGFVSRTLPQLNILTVGFPMKLMVFTLISAVALCSMEHLFLDALAEFVDMTRAGLGLPAMY